MSGSIGDHDLRLSLVSGWIDEVRRVLDGMGCPYPPDPPDTPEDEQTGDEVVGTALFHARDRRISTRPRAVRISGQLQCPPEVQSGLDALKRVFERGEDVTPFLSSGILLTRRPNGEPALDGLLSDWGIHHFHLDPTPDPGRPGFNRRTGPILLARVADDEVMFLDVRFHETREPVRPWNQQDLLAILASNFPDQMERYRVECKGIESGQISDDEHSDLRYGNINALVQLPDGSISIGPGGGMTSAGTSLTGMLRHISVMKELRKAEAHIRDNIGEYAKEAERQGTPMSSPFSFSPLIDGDEVFAHEVNSGARFHLFTLP